MRWKIKNLATKHAEFETSMGELDRKQYVFTLDQLIQFIDEYVEVECNPMKDVNRIDWIEEMAERSKTGITLQCLKNPIIDTKPSSKGYKIITDGHDGPAYETLRKAINETTGWI